MKIILLHGDHSTKSRERLQRFIDVSKKRNWEIVRSSQLTDTNIVESISANTLFKKKRLFVIDELSKVRTKELEWMRTSLDKFDGNLVCYHNKTISKTLLTKLPEIDKTEEYKLPKLIFTLLENFYPGNAEKLLKLLHDTLEKDAAEFVMALLSRHLKDLYKIKKNENGVNLPPWRKNKLKSQANKFESGEIEKLIEELATIDVETKTSDSTALELLDLLIIDKLK